MHERAPTHPHNNVVGPIRSGNRCRNGIDARSWEGRHEADPFPRMPDSLPGVELNGSSLRVEAKREVAMATQPGALRSVGHGF